MPSCIRSWRSRRPSRTSFPPFPPTRWSLGKLARRAWTGSVLGAFAATWVGNVGGAAAMYVVGWRHGADRMHRRFPRLADERHESVSRRCTAAVRRHRAVREPSHSRRTCTGASLCRRIARSSREGHWRNGRCVSALVRHHQLCGIQRRRGILRADAHREAVRHDGRIMAVVFLTAMVLIWLVRRRRRHRET